MITRLSLANYRNHANTTLQLRPLSMLIGPVASGKSNVFKALIFLQNTIHRDPSEYFAPGLGEFRWVRSRWAKLSDSISFQADVAELDGFPDETGRYHLEIAEGPDGTIFVLSEWLRRIGPDGGVALIFERRQRGGPLGEFGHFRGVDPTVLHSAYRMRDGGPRDLAETIRFARSVAHTISKCGMYHLEASRIQRPSDREIAVDRIGYRGDNVPAFLKLVRQQDLGQGCFSHIVGELKELVPSLEQVLINTTTGGQEGVSFQFQDHEGYIAAPDVSDGTLLTLALLCVIHQPQLPRMLCIEEPENGLHPQRLKWLFDRFASLAYSSQDSDRCQVLISSHSPYLLDFFREDPDAVQVVSSRDGRAHIRGLGEILDKLNTTPASGNTEPVPLGHQWYMGLFDEL